jgi:hypothetical protein
VHERQHDAGRELFHAHVLDQVRADPPVRLLEHVIDHPPAVRRLQQWMVHEQYEASAGREDARHLGDRRDVVGDVLEDEAGYDGVERIGSERQGLGCGTRVHRSAGANARDVQLRTRRIDSHGPRAEAGSQARDLTLPRADVEHSRRARQAFRRDRQDLLFVLGIGSVREPVLPPLGVALPEVVGHGSS